MKVSDILRVKGGTLYTVSPDETLGRAVETMAQFDIGSLAVMEHGELVGMLTFRELIDTLARNGGKLDGKIPNIKGIFWHGSDWFNQLTNINKEIEAIKKLELVVCSDSTITPSRASRASLVRPSRRARGRGCRRSIGRHRPRARDPRRCRCRGPA